MSAVHKIEFNANPTQQQFIESQARADLFATRFGEGKSAGLAWSIWYHTAWNPGAKWALVRDTWENLRRTTLEEFFEWFPQGLMVGYAKADKYLYWLPASKLSGQIHLFGMDDDNSIARFQSLTLAGIAYDEVAPAVKSAGIPELVFDIGLGRLRQKGMNWYACKLATNNPDETHWSYSRFVDPGNPRYKAFHPRTRENEHNLPAGYYDELEADWEARPDLKRRFIDGKYGYQQIGKKVTPEYSPELHQARKIEPIKGLELILLWDFGLNPTCLVTQISPLGHWNFLRSHVGEDMGAYELITDVVKPALAQHYPKYKLEHIGDPNGVQREQSSSRQSAVKVIKKELGGKWRSGMKDFDPAVMALRRVLGRTRDGIGLVRIDRHNAKDVWLSLRGGWHFHVASTGIVSNEPVKDLHSHPGDACRYGASILFPLGELSRKKRSARSDQASAWTNRTEKGRGLGFERPGLKLPQHGQKMKIVQKTKVLRE